mmetsp:Transcript_15216/g.63226  ORF Transcript_15216/g.63226 Transcript_15216/m.63226 type:complete len:239 (+) Transcript_15216:1773-2489(+)
MRSSAARRCLDRSSGASAGATRARGPCFTDAGAPPAPSCAASAPPTAPAAAASSALASRGSRRLRGSRAASTLGMSFVTCAITCATGSGAPTGGAYVCCWSANAVRFAMTNSASTSAGNFSTSVSSCGLAASPPCTSTITLAMSCKRASSGVVPAVCPIPPKPVRARFESPASSSSRLRFASRSLASRCALRSARRADMTAASAWSPFPTAISACASTPREYGAWGPVEPLMSAMSDL